MRTAWLAGVGLRASVAASVVVSVAACSFPTPADVGPDAGGSGDDASVDTSGNGPRVTDMQVPLRVAAGDTVDLLFTIEGAASSTVDWTITSGGGSFAPSGGTIATNASGVGVLHASYTAPAATGDDAHVLSLVGGLPASFTTLVRVLAPIGENVAFASSNGQAIISNELYAQKVTVAAPTVAMKLGFIVDVTGPNARMALYADSAGAPGDLVATTSQIAVTGSVTEPSLTAPVAIGAGNYWIVGNFETQTHVRNDTTRMSPQAFASLSFVAAFPVHATTTAISDSVLNYYLLVAN